MFHFVFWFILTLLLSFINGHTLQCAALHFVIPFNFLLGYLFSLTVKSIFQQQYTCEVKTTHCQAHNGYAAMLKSSTHTNPLKSALKFNLV